MKVSALLLLIACTARAADLAPVFTDNAVLQRDLPVAVWGTGRDGEKVEVEILGRKAAAEVRDGRWSVTLGALPATDSTTLTLRADNTVELKNVAVGEVWLALGQSNMEWRLNQCGPFTESLLATADQPAIRQLKIPRRAFAGEPFPAFAWRTFDRASAPEFSAVAYFFAAELHRKLDVPVGIVNCSYGGTAIEAWMTRASLEAAGMQDKLAQHDRKLAAWVDPAAYEQAWTDFLAARKAWEEKEKANPNDPALGPRPKEPYGPRSKDRMTGLHEAMLSVITPFTARGALWYQGESNAGQPADYARMLPAFVSSLREAWGQPALPFFIAQLANPSSKLSDHNDEYAKFRDMQVAASRTLPHSGLVVTLDRGKRGDVHPPDKQPVGERFARLALARTYGQTGFAAQSPSAEAARMTNGRIAITFRDLTGQLNLRDPAIPTLEIQSADGAWHPATAEISADGKALLVSPGDSVPPSAVRYGWRNFCPLTIFTDEDLPVSPWSLNVAP